jgi:hypothetical protein
MVSLMWEWFRRRELIARYVAATDPPRPARPTGIAPGRVAKVPGKCVGLHNYLVNRHADNVVLTFTQIEDLLGSALPDSARARQEWWTNQDNDADKSSLSDAWVLAGRTAKANLLARTVAFERHAEPLRDAKSGRT